MTKITAVTVRDIRFPTSRNLDGSDAMNPDPDYSAAYVVLQTDQPGPRGPRPDLHHRPRQRAVRRGGGGAGAARGRARRWSRHHRATWARSGAASPATASCAGSARRRACIHLATAAVVNAVWDLWAKAEGKPLWKLLADMTPEELVRCIDFRYITDALTPDEALAILQRQRRPTQGRAHRRDAERTAIPAYTTSAGWLGYPDDKIRRLCREAMAQGFTHFKIKVGRDLADDIRALPIVREEIGRDRKLMIDANQVWDVGQAIA